MTPSRRHLPLIMMIWWQNMSDDALERITILLQAKDRDLQRAIDRNNKLISVFTKKAAAETKKMSTEIDAHISKVGKTVMGMGRAFAVGLGTGVVAAAFSGISTNLVGMVRGIAEVGDQAKRSGLGTKEFQEWQFVAQQNRIGVDSLVDAFKELSLRSDEFIQTGAGPAKESLDRLGISAADLKTKLKDPSALMLEIIGRLEGMSKAAQIRIADELFGGTGGERFVELLAQGEGGLRKTIDRAHEVGAVLDEEMIQKAAEIDRRFQELSTRIAFLLKKGIVEGFARDDTTDILGDEKRAESLLGADLKSELDKNGLLLDEHAQDVESLGLSYDALQAAVSAASGAIAGDLAYLVEVGADDLAIQLAEITSEMELLVAKANAGTISAEKLDEGMQALVDSAMSAFAEAQKIDGVNLENAVASVDRVSSALQVARDWAAGLVDKMREASGLAPVAGAIGQDTGTPLSGDVADLMPPSPLAPKASPRPGRQSVDSFGNWRDAGSSGSGSGKGGGGASRDSFAASVTQIQEQTAALREEAAAFLEVAGSAQQYGDAAEFARTRARLLSEAQKAGKEITPELRAEIDYLAASYTEAGLAAEQAADRLEDMKTRAERGVDAVTDIFMAVTKGGDAAKQAVLGLLAEMAKMQFQQSLLRTASSGRGGSLFSVIGGLLGGKRAGGGPVQAGVPYLVNENTPRSEVFVPSSSGAILNVPQAQAAFRGAAGGGAVRVIGGDLTLSDNGTIMARVKVVGQQAAQAGASGAVQQVRANLSSWSKQIQTDGSLV